MPTLSLRMEKEDLEFHNTKQEMNLEKVNNLIFFR